MASIINDRCISGHIADRPVSCNKENCLDWINEEKQIDIDLESLILTKIEERNEAKKNKNYAKADEIRDYLLEKGIKLIDSRDGTTYEVI